MIHLYKTILSARIQATYVRLLVVVIVGLLGTAVVLYSHASTPAVSLEPEAGTVGGNAAVISTSSASGGSAVQFGANADNLNDKQVGFSIPLYPTPTNDQFLSWLADAKSVGASWIRIDISWQYIQASETGSLRWGPYDTYINDILSQGLKVDGIIDSTPTWDRNTGCSTFNFCAPADPAAYGTFAGLVAQHYGNKLGAVEIWNEPNIYQFWGITPDPSVYTAMLKAAYTNVKAADPNMLVISGGLSPAITDKTKYIAQNTYLSDMYALGAKGYFDVLGYHPYSYPIPPSQYETYSGWSDIDQTPTSMYSIMVANGDGAKRLWLTEYGAPTDGPETDGATCTDYIYTGRRKVDQCLQAMILSQAITQAKADSHIGTLFLYTYIDRGTATSTEENFYGIVDYNGVQKQSYSAVKAAIAGN